MNNLITHLGKPSTHMKRVEFSTSVAKLHQKLQPCHLYGSDELHSNTTRIVHIKLYN